MKALNCLVWSLLMGVFSLTNAQELSEVKFVTLTKGQVIHSPERHNRIITNSEEWPEFWRHTTASRVVGRLLPKPLNIDQQATMKTSEMMAPDVAAMRLPVIDFSRQNVIGVFQGAKTTGGHAIEITRIARTPTQLLVFIDEQSPKSECKPQPRDARTAAHVVVIPKYDLPVTFIGNHVARDCELKPELMDWAAHLTEHCASWATKLKAEVKLSLQSQPVSDYSLKVITAWTDWPPGIVQNLVEIPLK